MLRSLSSRLLVAFGFVIVLSLAVSAIGTLILLRDQQREAAEDRVGRLAEPIALAVALLEQQELEQEHIQDVVRGYAASFDVRILLLEASGEVVFDTGSSLAGTTIESYQEAGTVIRRGGAEFRMIRYNPGSGDHYMFASAQQSFRLSSSRLAEFQAFVYALDDSSLSRALLSDRIKDLLEEEGTGRLVPAASLTPMVAVPIGEITSAWQEVIPQLAIAASVALLASAFVALFISRTISRPLASITQAAQEMARGNYDQELDVRSSDEVGRLAQTFNEMARQISLSDEMMRDFLANVSHELKTPLTSIQGFSQALEDGAISSPQQYEEAGRIINEETQRMRRLVDGLIELSRLESGQIAMQREPIDLPRLLQTCAGRFERRALDSGATLRVDIPPLPTIEGDEGRLEQAFSNLIDNAVRHTPEGGAVNVRAQAANGAVRVTIHNTGSYIPREDLPRVFERFFQLDRHRKRGSGGAGLGLAIVSEVMQAHGGGVNASSDEAEGTEFVVTLPIPPGSSTAGVNSGERRS